MGLERIHMGRSTLRKRRLRVAVVWTARPLLQEEATWSPGSQAMTWIRTECFQ